MPIATKKRIKQVSLELRPCELEYLISGYDFFNDIDMGLIKEKWQVHRDFIMKHCEQNEPGGVPFGVTEFDKK